MPLSVSSTLHSLSFGGVVGGRHDDFHSGDDDRVA